MLNLTNLAQFSLLLLGTSYGSPTLIKRAEPIRWGACEPALEKLNVLNLTIYCANYTVPLDCTDPNNGTVDLQLLKIPATIGKSNGSVLFNPGGPGDTPRPYLLNIVTQILTITGGNHDLVTFDTRGTGNTLTMTCRNETELALWNTIFPVNSNSSDTTIGEQWAYATNLAELCYARLKDIGRFVGTAFVARDLISVVNALGEQDLNYYGGSYGTTLGATVAAMFPDRMGKVVLDGVLNSHEYYNDYEKEWISKTDISFSGFFSGCVAAENGTCALAVDGKTAEQLESEFYDFLWNLKYQPIPNPETQSIIRYTDLKSAVLVALYSPPVWPMLAAALDSLYNGTNLTAWNTYYAAGASASSSATPDAIYGIKCSDKNKTAATFEEYAPAMEETYKQSKILGDEYTAWDMICSQWKMPAKERYEGDFNVTTKNPILFIGNTFDPLTPLVSSKNMSSGFGNSVLLTHDGYGHTFLAQGGGCTIKAVQKYFADWTLPEPGTVCENDQPLFGDVTFQDLLVKLNSTA